MTGEDNRTKYWNKGTKLVSEANLIFPPLIKSRKRRKVKSLLNNQKKQQKKNEIKVVYRITRSSPIVATCRMTIKAVEEFHLTLAIKKDHRT